MSASRCLDVLRKRVRDAYGRLLRSPAAGLCRAAPPAGTATPRDFCVAARTQTQVSMSTLFGSLFALMTYRALLDLSYAIYVIPHAAGTYVLDPSPLRVLGSLLLDVALFLCLPRSRRLSSVCLALLFALAMVPLHSLYAMMGVAESWVLTADAGFLLTLLVVRIVPAARVTSGGKQGSAIVWGSALCSLGAYGGLLETSGLPTLTATDLNAVYAVRSAYSASVSGVLAYLVNWQGAVINPFWTGFLAAKRRYVWLVVPIGLQVFLYLYTANKVSLLACPLVLLLGYLAGRRVFLTSLFVALGAAIALSLLLLSLGAPDNIPDQAIRRMLFTPAMNGSIFYDFFSVHPKVLWSHSFLTGIAPNPYGQNPIYMLGQMWSGTAFSMNVGYLADGYMNLGLPGVLFVSLLLGAILVFLDSLALRTPPAIALAAVAMPIRSLVDAALLTTLATHGLIVGALALWLCAASQCSTPGSGR